MGVTCGELAIQDVRKDIIGDMSHHPGFGPWGLGSPALVPRAWSDLVRPPTVCSLLQRLVRASARPRPVPSLLILRGDGLP
jgi:hypothetical protein